MNCSKCRAPGMCICEPAPHPETVEVPVEPTREMIVAGNAAFRDGDGSLRTIWPAMLAARPHAASPTTPDAGVETVEINRWQHLVVELRTENASLRAQLAEAEAACAQWAERDLQASAALAEKDRRIAEERAINEQAVAHNHRLDEENGRLQKRIAELKAKRDLWKGRWEAERADSDAAFAEIEAELERRG